MKARLVAVTQPVGEIFAEGIETPNEFVAFCARVSNPGNQFNNETADKLIAYLIRNKHWSPLEMVDAVVEVESTRDIVRQILRHWSHRFQEFSQRYADPTEMEFEIKECRFQDAQNRQNSIDADQDSIIAKQWKEKQQEFVVQSVDLYKWAVQSGIAKEVARAVLPEGMTPSKLYMKASLRSWIHYIEARTYKGAQKEHRLLAIAIAKAISDVYPIINEYVAK